MIKKTFCEAWIKTAERGIEKKPSEAEFYKVVAMIDAKHLWDSQIMVFYSKNYYDVFWKSIEKHQRWIPLAGRSYIIEKNLHTELNEIGYQEVINDEDEYCTRELWFYGNL